MIDSEIQPASLSSALRGRTRTLHTRAERSGIVADILRRRVTKRGYALFLRNLAPIYRQLEDGLDQHRRTPGVGAFARRELYRSAALEADLIALFGPGWADALPPPSAASEHYARRVQAAADGSGASLIGHAYVRFMGDLSGGQAMGRLLADTLDLPRQALSFYDFPQIADLTAYKGWFRDALDGARLAADDREAVISSATEAFSMNIDLSDAVRRTVLAWESAAP